MSSFRSTIHIPDFLFEEMFLYFFWDSKYYISKCLMSQLSIKCLILCTNIIYSSHYFDFILFIFIFCGFKKKTIFFLEIPEFQVLFLKIQNSVQNPKCWFGFWSEM